MNRIEHIGIAVKDAETSLKLFSSLLGYEPYKSEGVESEHVNTHFFKLGENKIELLEATSSDSPIARFIDKRGEGVHHIAIAVDNIQKEIERLTSEGFKFTSDGPRPGADNQLICFLHPTTTNGVLIELCQRAS